MVERRYLKVGLAVVATAALVIGLSVGIARGGSRSSSPSDASALSAYYCEGDGASSSYYNHGGGKSGKSGTASKSGKGVKSSSGKSGKSASLLYDVSTESGSSQEEMSYGGGEERGSASMSLEFGRRLLDGEDSWSSASPRRRRMATTRRGLGSATRGEGMRRQTNDACQDVTTTFRATCFDRPLSFYTLAFLMHHPLLHLLSAFACPLFPPRQASYSRAPRPPACPPAA